MNLAVKTFSRRIVPGHANGAGVDTLPVYPQSAVFLVALGDTTLSFDVVFVFSAEAPAAFSIPESTLSADILALSVEPYLTLGFVAEVEA